MSVIIKDPSDLTLFQRWVLIHFHQHSNERYSDAWLIQNCCITALTQQFDKNTGQNDIRELASMQLIRYTNKIENGHESGFGRLYVSSMDGMIYVKKMLMPILNAMDGNDFKTKLQTLTEPQIVTLFTRVYENYRATGSQSNAISEISNVGLGNISKFSAVWKLFN